MGLVAGFFTLLASCHFSNEGSSSGTLCAHPAAAVFWGCCVFVGSSIALHFILIICHAVLKFVRSRQGQAPVIPSTMAMSRLNEGLEADDLPAEIPVREDGQSKQVKELVGKNFIKVIKKTGKAALVLFYDQSCVDKSLDTILDQLTEKYADNDKIMIAKVDANQDELEDAKIELLPALKFFPAGTEEIVDYKGGQTLKDFVTFLGKNLASSGSDEEK